MHAVEQSRHARARFTKHDDRRKARALMNSAQQSPQPRRIEAAVARTEHVADGDQKGIRIIAAETRFGRASPPQAAAGEEFIGNIAETE